MALERLKNCANVCALARELGIDRTVLYHWQRQAGEQRTDSTATSPVRELRKQERDLKRVLGEKTLEVDFFKGALQKIEARRRGRGGSGGTASTTRSGK
jgi:transposase-like protein